MPAFMMFLYGLASYASFLLTFLCLIAFVGNFPVPKTIDGGAPVGLVEAGVVNVLLLAVFAVQHSVMARPAFKRWWTRFVPQAIERSTYVVAASAALALVVWQWRPMAEPVLWHIENPLAVAVLLLLFGLGWGVVLISSFLINHFELFGLSQVYFNLVGRAPKAQEFRTPLLYRHVRHPLYLGVIIGSWATPKMSLGHGLFALGMTVYILIGVVFEERDLVKQFGERYLRYREQVGMLLPWPRKGRAAGRSPR